MRNPGLFAGGGDLHIRPDNNHKHNHIGRNNLLHNGRD